MCSICAYPPSLESLWHVGNTVGHRFHCMVTYKLLGLSVCRAPLTFRTVHYMGLSLLHLWAAFSILWLLLFFLPRQPFFDLYRERSHRPPSLSHLVSSAIYLYFSVSLLSCCLLFYNCCSIFPTFLSPSPTLVSPLVTYSAPYVFSCDSLDLIFFSIHTLSLLNLPNHCIHPSVPLACIDFLSAVPFSIQLFLFLLSFLNPLFTCCNSWSPSVSSLAIRLRMSILVIFKISLAVTGTKTLVQF